MSASTPTAPIAVIGLGVIGKPIAARLARSGLATAVFDLRAEPMAALAALGARAASSPRDAARGAQIVLSLVSDEAQTREVVLGADGVLATMGAGSIFATGSTLGPAPVRALAEELAAHGIDTLDMPISGGFTAAEQGTLSLMIGASEATLARALPVLRWFARDITRAGEVGAGQAAKLAHQLVLSVNILALLEGLALGKAGGVEPAVLKDILRQGLASSKALDAWGDFGARWKSMMRPTAPGAPLPNLRKDLHHALELARTLGVALPVGTEASRVADAGSSTGHDDPAL